MMARLMELGNYVSLGPLTRAIGMFGIYGLHVGLGGIHAIGHLEMLILRDVPSTDLNLQPQTFNPTPKG